VNEPAKETLTLCFQEELNGKASHSWCCRMKGDGAYD
jgi:hypothetical protein